jgi:hypothetical protein
LPPQTLATLRTQNTVVQLRADDGSPRLVSFGAGSQRNWPNASSERLIDSVFIGERIGAIHWRLNRQESRIESSRVAFVYTNESPRLRLTWEWRTRSATGPVEHTISIENLGSDEIWIPLQDSLAFRVRVDPGIVLKHFFVEKGAGKPSDAGTHLAAMPIDYKWSGESSTYAHPANGQAREIIPFSAVEDAGAGGTGWYTGIEFSGRTVLTLDRNERDLSGTAGFNATPGPFRTRLKPGDTFVSPTVFLGAYTGGLDALGNILRRWVREVLTNPRAWQNPNYPLLVNNSWGSGMQVDDALARKMIRESSELGLDMFHLDAGWFRGVGDWYPDSKKFPDGLASLADDAHQQGLKFGLWVDWTQAALGAQRGALNLKDPKVRDWTVCNVPLDWKPQEFKGLTIDIGAPQAAAYAQREVLRIVRDYHLDMLEHDGYLVAQGCVRTDHPHAPPDAGHTSIEAHDGSYFVLSSNSTDVSYHAVRAYYEIYENLRRQYPGILLEICNDGGRMVDFGSAAHGDYFSITDAYDPLSNRRAFYDTSHMLPAAMLEAYVQKWPTPRIENFLYMLRSGMQGWLTIMQDTNSWSKEQHEAAKEQIRLYKAELRPLIREADLYHVSPRPDGVHWDGTEFFDSKRGRGVVFAFRGSIENEGEHVYKLQGLNANKQHRLRFHDHGAADRAASGRELATNGLRVRLPIANSSELIFIDEVR